MIAFRYQPVIVRGKEVSRLVGRLNKQVTEMQEGRAATLCDHIAFRDPNHAAWSGHALVLLQEFGPVPGAYIPLPPGLLR